MPKAELTAWEIKWQNSHNTKEPYKELAINGESNKNKWRTIQGSIWTIGILEGNKRPLEKTQTMFLTF